MFSFIKEILNSKRHSEIFNYDEEVIQLNLSYNEILILHYLIKDKINKVASRDTGQLTEYLDALKKIGEKIVERWNGKN